MPANRSSPSRRTFLGATAATADPLASAHGWYDVGVTVDGHQPYLRRFAGHLENGRASITG